MSKKIGDLELYDVQELAGILGLQVLTVRRMLKAGKIRGRKLAKRWYVTSESLREYFQLSEAEAQAAALDEGAHGLR